MSENTSQTGFPLAPAETPGPLTEPDLTNFIQAWVVGITGLPGDLVRPRWQPTPPNQPPAATTWCGIGITSRSMEGGLPYVGHDEADGVGFDRQERHEIIALLASFYGPNGADMAALFTSGAYIAQNREALFLADMGLLDVGNIDVLPDLSNGRWIMRADLPFRLRRKITRDYPVRSLAEGPFNITSEPT